MKNRLWAAAALPAALVALSGCVYSDDYSYGGWSGSYGAVGVGYSSGYPGYYAPGYYRPYAYGPVYYDAFYDNFYGPIYGGYWHTDNFFYYQTHFGSPWYCDYGRHFRREHFRGGNHYRFEDRRPAEIVERATDRILGPGRNDPNGQPNGGQYTGGQYNGGPSGILNNGFQGNPGSAPAPQRGRGGPMNAINGLLGGPGGSSGDAPAAASPPPAPAPRSNVMNRVQDAFRGDRGGDSGGVSRSQGERSAPAPRSSPPPAPRPSVVDTARGRILGGKRDD
jgi:hypothetical protein